MLEIKEFNELKKNLKKDFSSLKKIKVALLGDTATQFLVQAIRASGYEMEFNLEIWEADFNQIEQQVFDPTSRLYEFNPEVIIIYKSTHKLLQKYNKLAVEAYITLAESELGLISSLVDKLGSISNARIIFFNYAEIDDSVFGNYASKIEQSFLFQTRKLNFDLMKLAIGQGGFYLLDLSSLQNQHGKKAFFNPAFYINTEMVLTFSILPVVATAIVRLIGAIAGKFKKCLIVDLDNTLWGGVIGDDGLENIQLGGLGIGKAFSEFQYWLKKLKNRGIILAVCSKNSEVVAKEPFEKHRDMVLHLDDIAVFVANWENKADNIRLIQRVLNIGFDSMVFLDDNPFERNLVKENIPELTVPELPEDPGKYLEYLYPLNLFETISYSGEDAQRTELYQIENQRIAIQQQFTNVDDFLINLEMHSEVQPFNHFNMPRVAQLSQRSNQFNLRTTRYNEADILELSKSAGTFSFTFNLLDKFGDNGLICVIILKEENAQTLFIDTWLMSCRVLKRGMENFALNTIVDFAVSKNYHYLKGEYLPTAKNEMVKNHYQDLGFMQSAEYWILKTNNFNVRKCYIKSK